MTTSTHPAQPRSFSFRDWLPWLVFACGVAIVPAVFFIGCLSSHPPANWDTSFFGRSLARPFLILGFCCCCLSPLLTKLAVWLRLVLVFGGAAVFGLVFLVLEMILWFLYPPLV
jgi:hypothetical protein